MKKYLSSATLLLLSCFAFAEAPRIVFVENKSQWPEQVKFKADIKGGTIFLEKNFFTYVFTETGFIDEAHSHEQKQVKLHAVKVNFLNSNQNVMVSGNKQLQGVRNYYMGNDARRWASEVKQFGLVHYDELYPSIDMNVYNVEENLKYDLIVQPGGDVKNIRMNYAGPDEMHIEYGHLYLKTSVGLIIEQKPYAYQFINGEKKEIPCSYVLKQNQLSFQVGKYDPAIELVIDPTLIGSTYTGSTTDNRGYTATYDATGNMYTGGKAFDIGYPTITGAYMPSWQGSALWLITISKFNTNATQLLYSTYFGGINPADDQQVHSIIVNSANELYMAGRTNSLAFPTTAGVFQPASGGGFDIVVAKFGLTGNLLASTYLGGSADESVNVSVGTAYSDTKVSWGDDGRSEIIIDVSGNVCVASNTHSANFPVSAGAYDNTLGGSQDGVVFKMNSTLSALPFSTYIGGSLIDAAYGLKTDNAGKMYITGGTTSADFPIPAVSPAVIQPAFGGTVDGFIAVFDPIQTGPSQLVRATYLGTAQYDQSYLIEIDASSDLYVYGQTAGFYPVTPGVYSYPNSSPASGMFIHKLTGNLSTTVFSTVIGSAGGGVNLSPTAFLIDSCQTIYISGWGRCLATGGQWMAPYQSSTVGLPVTSNAFQSTTDGCDFYFAVLTPDAKSLSYGTFFGSNTANPDHVDGGTSRFDRRGVIYESVCASCLGTQGFPTTPGAYSSTNNALDNAQCNNALVKMDVSVNPIAKANVIGATTGCAPFQVCFKDSGTFADNEIWDYGDGGTDTIKNPCHTYYFPGTYTITLYAIDSIGICGYIDTSRVVVHVGKAPALSTAATTILCNGGVASATVTATGGVTPYSYIWPAPTGNVPVANNLLAGTYSVIVKDSTGCADTAAITINQPPVISIAPSTTLATCGILNGHAAVSVSGGMPGYSYTWSSGQSTSAIHNVAAGSYTITVKDQNACTKLQVITIATANGPTVTATLTASVSCNSGNSGAASSAVIGGTPPYTFQWSPTSAGNSQNSSNLYAGTYFIVVTDSLGCIGIDSVNIPEPNPISISIVPGAVACSGGNNGTATANPSGGTPPYNYTWNTNPVQNTQTAVGLSSGVYTVTVKDKNNCIATASVSINVAPGALAVSASPTGNSCQTYSNAVIVSNVSNGTPQYTYQWFPGGQTTQNISNVMGGTYTVIVKDGNNCTAAATATVGTSPEPVANFDYTVSISCEGATLHFQNTSINGTSWNWNFGNLGSSSLQNPSVTFPYSGTYTVTLTVSNPPCLDTESKPVVVGDLGNGIAFKEANVFTPNGDNLNDCFLPALSGTGADSLKECIELEVFDRWGVKMFESIGSDNCWNGKNRKDSKDALDGTYYYIAKLGETTIRGYVTLARHK